MYMPALAVQTDSWLHCVLALLLRYIKMGAFRIGLGNDKEDSPFPSK